MSFTIFEKDTHVCDYRTHKSPTVCPEMPIKNERKYNMYRMQEYTNAIQ